MNDLFSRDWLCVCATGTTVGCYVDCVICWFSSGHGVSPLSEFAPLRSELFIPTALISLDPSCYALSSYLYRSGLFHLYRFQLVFFRFGTKAYLECSVSAQLLVWCRMPKAELAEVLLTYVATEPSILTEAKLSGEPLKAAEAALADAPLGPTGLPKDPAKANTCQSSPKRGKINKVKPQYEEHKYSITHIRHEQRKMSTINTSSDQLLPIQLPTAHYLHSVKTSEPKAQQGYTDPSTYTPDPSSVERAHGSSAAHSPFLWGPSLFS
ncbi:U-box domain-containing protein 36-like [Dorcoceras hygrometricum]|uniref:U-box domain-containing protein 36-like n=1 Tax=Dorcoceras hygrometricum TaxID=472368 RepID=A0A2Z7CZN7_9LAMI|nr:U-box domain-containing protein 36-like [Dorcoceras hygrometricum]